MGQNGLQDTFAILQHLVVPESKHLPPLARQISVTGLVARAFRVLRTVSLDDQLNANAKKVDDVRSKRDLSAKLNAIQAAVAQKTPEAQLGVGLRGAHRSSARALVRRDACVSLHRSPIGGAALIRRAFGAPPSPRGRREVRDGVWHVPSLSGERANALPFGAPRLPRGEGGRSERGRMRVGASVASRLRKRPALRRQLLHQRRGLEIVAELGLKFLELG